MAIEKGLLILPVTVNGSRRVLAKRSLVFSPGPIEVVVSDPIETGEYSAEGLQKLLDRTREVVISNFNPHYPHSGKPS